MVPTVTMEPNAEGLVHQLALNVTISVVAVCVVIHRSSTRTLANLNVAVTMTIMKILMAKTNLYASDSRR